MGTGNKIFQDPKKEPHVLRAEMTAKQLLNSAVPSLAREKGNNSHLLSNDYNSKGSDYGCLVALKIIHELTNKFSKFNDKTKKQLIDKLNDPRQKEKND